ncbi:hypothetical protein NDU88_011193 [Pleurodeles waltl]|uniref:Uncharacterized protein n=1 Tax=Pleurodeles waltl TaxID=8319 RepID=A0AAV7PZY9_PLEWA|nr:hypothetical protein NDU88_011193 [Pleurodeles waltl]
MKNQTKQEANEEEPKGGRNKGRKNQREEETKEGRNKGRKNQREEEERKRETARKKEEAREDPRDEEGVGMPRACFAARARTRSTGGGSIHPGRARSRPRRRLSSIPSPSEGLLPAEQPPGRERGWEPDLASHLREERGVRGCAPEAPAYL